MPGRWQSEPVFSSIWFWRFFGVFTLDIPVSVPDLVIGVIAAALVEAFCSFFF